MQVLRFVSGLIAALVMSARIAAAEDYALIYGDIGQIASFKNTHGMVAEDFAAPLRDAGFRIIQPKNRSSGHMRLAAEQVEALMAQNRVERLVIVALGPVASGRNDSWIMSNEAASATSLNIGVTGISVNGLSDLAERAGGPAVILMAPGPKIETLGIGLTPGPGTFARAEGVTYGTGRADRLLPVLEDMLDPDTSFADAARDAPKPVRLSGHLPKFSGLMGELESPATPAAIEQGFWQAISELDLVEGYELYLEKYPGGQHRTAAENRINRLKTEPERQARDAEDALNLSRDARRAVQRNLDLLGFDPRGIDGVFGPGSRSAIKAWQRDNGFEDTGFLNGNQLLRLRDQARKRAEELEEEDRLRQLEEERKDRAYWRETGRGSDEAGLRSYVERFPDGVFSEVARARLDEIEDARRAETEREEILAWDEARAADTIPAYRDFLDAYPGSGFADAARSRLRELQEARQNAGAIEQAKSEERSIAGSKVARLLIEQRLAQVGANPGEIDGKFTKQTRQAIRRFQRHRELPVTGFVSRKTMVRLMGGK